MRHFLPSVGLVCLLVLTSAGQRCVNAPIKTSRFVPMETPYSGCDDSLPTHLTHSIMDCARICQEKAGCVAFGYDRTANLCRVCAMNTQGSLYDSSPASTSTSTFYALSQGLKTGPTKVTPLNMQIDLDCGVNVGTMIVLRGIQTDINGYTLVLRQDVKTIPLSFKSGSLTGGTTGPLVTFQTFTFSSMVKGGYVSQKSLFYNPFLIPVNAEFELRILAREDNYVFYVNGTYLANYTYVLHPENTQAIEITNSLKLIELNL